MKIEFTKEDVEQIRRLCRSELQSFWYSANKEMLDIAEEELKKEMEKLK